MRWSGSTWTIACVWLVTTLLWLTPGITRPDGAGYYSYLPSIVLGHDLVFFDEWERFGMISNGIVQHKEITATSHLGNHWTIGSAVAWLPGFLTGDLLRFATGATRDGISLPYNVGVLAANSLLALAALLLAATLVTEIVGAGAATAVVGAWFGTPLLFYATRSSISPHVLATTMSALALLLALGLRSEITKPRMIAFGLVIGFAFAVRPQLAPLAALPFFLVPRNQWGTLLRSAPLSIAAAFIASLPQWLVSFYVYGQPLGFLGVGSAAKPFAAFERVWTWEPLFSWYHGLFVWTPYALLGVLGLIALWKRDRGVSAAGLFIFVMQWFVNALLERSFWGAWSFGQRRFDSVIPFFILGVATLVAIRPRLTAVLVSACALWTWLIFVSTTAGLNLSAYHTPGEMMAVMAHSASTALTIFRPFAFVPDAARNRVLLLFLLTLGALLLLAMCIAAVARTTARRNAVAAALLLMVSFAIMLASLNSSAVITRYASTIAASREQQRVVGGADARVALLRDEVEYLRKSGRRVEAERTARELALLVEGRLRGGSR